jgi:hypothetical protein
MHQEALRRHVLRLLRIWRDWFIFADDFLNGLQVVRPAPDTLNGTGVVLSGALRSHVRQGERSESAGISHHCAACSAGRQVRHTLVGSASYSPASRIWHDAMH